MGNAIPKMFVALLADKVKRWAVTIQRYSESQEGSMQIGVCFEHKFVLQEDVLDAEVHKKDLAVAWLDLSNAFNSCQFLTHPTFGRIKIMICPPRPSALSPLTMVKWRRA